MVPRTSWASAALGLGQHPPAMGMCETGVCQNLPFTPENEVVMMKVGEGCLK